MESGTILKPEALEVPAASAPDAGSSHVDRMRAVVDLLHEVRRHGVEPAAALHLGVEGVLALVTARAAWISSRIDGEWRIRVAAGRTPAPPLQRDPLARSAEAAIESHRAMRWDRPAPDSQPEHRLFERDGLRSAITLPLVAFGSPAGVLTAVSDRPQAFCTADALTLDVMASMFALMLTGTVPSSDDHQADQRRLEGELARGRRIEAIGQLAAGLAHELNTPIQYVGDNLRFLTQAFGDLMPLVPAVADDRTEPGLAFLQREVPLALQQSAEGVERIADIVGAMKAFSHPATGERTATDLNRLLHDVVIVTRHEWKYVADLETDLDPGLPLVPCVPDEVQHVAFQLLVNAAHALEDRHPADASARGKIRIVTRHDDTAVVLQIADNGAGIPPEHRTRIFEPFFTTKEPGRGTGAGLAMAHDVVVTRHGGSIGFETTIGQGTTFTVRLPRTGPGEQP